MTNIEARLRTIEEEGYMTTEDVVLKQVPSARVAELSALAASYDGDDVGPVIGSLYDQMFSLLAMAGIQPAGPPIAYYEPEPGPSRGGASGDGQVRVHAAVEVASGTTAAEGLDVLDLPGIESAATIVHRGAMDEAFRSMQILARWIDDNGYRPVGHAREVCLQFDHKNPADWVHEF